MIKYKEFIKESLDRPYDYSVTKRSSSWVFEFFPPDGDDYDLQLDKIDNRMVDVSLTAYRDGGRPFVSVTNTGSNALRIYATIGAAIKEYVKEYPQIKVIRFESVDDRTLKVYELLMKRIARHFKSSDYEKNGKEFLIWIK